LRKIHGVVSSFLKLDRYRCVFKLVEFGEKLFYYFRYDERNIKEFRVVDLTVYFSVYSYSKSNLYYLVRKIDFTYDTSTLDNFDFGHGE
jgi:hypothetical protein